MNSQDAPMSSRPARFAEPPVKIHKPIGAAIIFTGGSEPFSIRAEVVASRYHNAKPGDKTLILTPVYGSLVEISAETIISVLNWARGA